MLAYKINRSLSNSWKNTVEYLIYGVAAATLIGHMLLLDGVVTALNVLLVMLGVGFATLAIYQLTPINNWLDGKDVTLSSDADIILFESGKHPGINSRNLGQQNAA